MSNVHETDNEFEDQNNATHTHRRVIRRTKVVDTYQQEKNVIISEFYFKYLFQSESNSFHYFLLRFFFFIAIDVHIIYISQMNGKA